jgi:acyl-CoA thioester hydrolase
LRKIELEYVRPARLDDLIEVHTCATSLTGARMTAKQNIFCKGALLTRGHVEACIMTLDGRPRRIPQTMRDKLAPLVAETFG